MDPDTGIDSTPNRTFKGEEAQLGAAIASLQKEVVKGPVNTPRQPAFADRSGHPEP